MMSPAGVTAPLASPAKRAQILQGKVQNLSSASAVSSTLVAFKNEILRKHTGKRTNSSKTVIHVTMDDWTFLGALIDQLASNVTRDSRLADNVASMATTINSLQADLHARFESLEERISSTQEAPASTHGGSYAQALLSSKPLPTGPMGVTAPPQPPTYSGRNTDLDVTLIQSDPADPVFTTSLFPELKKRIESAIAEAGLSSSDGRPLLIRAVSRHASKDLIVATHTKEDAHKLRTNASAWLPKFHPALNIRIPSYAIIAHRIPTSFVPSSPEAIQELKQDNPGILDSLERTVWANPKKAQPVDGPPKICSSLILYLTNPLHANLALAHQIAFRGTLRATEKSRRTLTQCHKCQRFGHTAARCSAQPACGRCASTHLTTACFCTETPPCPDHRTCPHIITRCVLCGDAHRATDKNCATRLKAAARLEDLNHHEGELFPVPMPPT
jgi:hypothetical protein